MSVDPLTATILPSATLQLTGRTFDGVGAELFGREALWTTSDPNVATVAPDGLVTGVAIEWAQMDNSRYSRGRNT